MFKAYSRSQWDQGNVCSIQFPAPPDSHPTILSAAPDISQKRCDLYPWNVRKHGKSEVSSQTYLQPKADLQRRKGFRTKSRKATRMIDVEIHYTGAPRFLDCSLKILAELLYFAWGKWCALKWAPNQSQNQWLTEIQLGQSRQPPEGGKKVNVIHLAMGIRLLTPGSRKYVQVRTVHKLGSYSEDRFKSLFSQEVSNFYFLLQYH